MAYTPPGGMPSGLLLYVDGDNISGAGVELVSTGAGPGFRATSATSGGYVTPSTVAIGASGTLLLQVYLDNTDGVYVMDGETTSNRDIFYQKGLGAGFGLYINGNEIADSTALGQTLIPTATLTAVLITWDGSATNIYKNGVFFDAKGAPASTGSARKLRFASRFNNLEGLTAGHILRVALFDRVLNSTERTDVSSLSWTNGDTTAPTLTGVITEVSKTENSISISWPAGSDNVAVTSYEVSNNAGTSYTDVGNVLAHTFTGLTASTLYALRVRAKDGAGLVSTPALALSVTTLAPDTTVPTWPGGTTLNAGTKTDTTVALSTSAAATDAVGVTGYEWSSDNGATYPFTSLTNSFTFTALADLTSYNFRVRAYDGAGNRSAHLALTTSTYRAGDTAANIIANTAPVGGNPAGHMYALALTLPSGTWMSYRTISGPTPSGGTLTEYANGNFTYFGLASAVWTTQVELNGVDHTEQTIVNLYDMTGGTLKTWNGSAWVVKPLKYWTGSAWVAKPLKRWNGSAWV